MPPVVAVGVWIWFAISCVVLARRALRRFVAPPARREPAASGTAGPVTVEVPAAPAVASPSGAPERSAPAASPVAARGLPVPSRHRVADVLAGIRLPCDLVPLTGSGSEPAGDGAVRFVTQRHDAHEVATAVGAELERLGLRFASGADGLGLATGERGAVRVEVRRVAEPLKGRPDPVYPTAEPGSVVVEFAPA